MLFRLLMGSFECNNKEGKACTFRQGDIVDTDDDLRRFNGGGGMTPKFEYIEQSFAPTVAPQPFSAEQKSMSDEELIEEMKRRGLLPSSKQATTSTAISSGSPPAAVKDEPGVKMSGKTIPADTARYPSFSGKATPTNKAEFVKMLHGGTVKDLQSLVEDAELEVDLKKVHGKEELIKAIVVEFE